MPHEIRACFCCIVALGVLLLLLLLLFFSRVLVLILSLSDVAHSLRLYTFSSVIEFEKASAGQNNAKHLSEVGHGET